MPVYSRLSDHSRRSMRPVGRLLLCRVVRVGLVKVFPTSRGLSLSGYLLVFRVVYRLPPGDPCCSFGFHLTDVPSGQLSELSSQLPKLTAHSSVFSSIKSKRGFPARCSPYGFNYPFPDPFRDLRDDGVSESSQTVHSLGNPISHSTHVGFNCPPFGEFSSAQTARSRVSV